MMMEHGQESGHMDMDHSDSPMPDMEHEEHPAQMHMQQKNIQMQDTMPEHDMQHGMDKNPSAENKMGAHSEQAKSGKQYAGNFGFLATDIASRQHLAIDGMSEDRPWPPYKQLKAIKPTGFDINRKIREIRLTLDGDMERYVWSLNNKTLSESDSISIRQGEVARFIMINRTMMHHPMHLHGHFFRVLNGQGEFSPLKHTVDVAPMSTTVIEFDASEKGDWFFHCHLLYHMMAGMARVVHYQDYTIDPELAAIRPNLYHDPWYYWGTADILSNMTEGMLTLSDTRNIISAYWEVGWENVNPADWEGILAWDRYFNRFFTIFAGIDLLGEGSSSDHTRGVAGFHYLLPLSVESRFWIDTDSGARISLEKSLELTPRLSLMGEVEYDTHDLWEGKVGLSYLVHKNISLKAAWHSDFLWGAGLQIRF